VNRFAAREKSRRILCRLFLMLRVDSRLVRQRLVPVLPVDASAILTASKESFRHNRKPSVSAWFFMEPLNGLEPLTC
jgi:hypothetical protein